MNESNWKMISRWCSFSVCRLKQIGTRVGSQRYQNYRRYQEILGTVKSFMVSIELCDNNLRFLRNFLCGGGILKKKIYIYRWGFSVIYVYRMQRTSDIAVIYPFWHMISYLNNLHYVLQGSPFRVEQTGKIQFPSIPLISRSSLNAAIELSTFFEIVFGPLWK